jgi:serine/threonine protein kinase
MWRHFSLTPQLLLGSCLICIFQGLATLKLLRICHGRLSLTNVLIRDGEDNDDKTKNKHVTLAGLGAGALYMPVPAGELIQPSSLTGCMSVVGCGTDPMYVAPEVFAGQAFDGAAIDLWAASVMLFVMLVGMQTQQQQQQQLQPEESEEEQPGNKNLSHNKKRPRMDTRRGSSRSLLFAAPVPADWRFTEICVKGHLSQLLVDSNNSNAVGTGMIDDLVDLSPAVVDLLQGLLHANPADRLTLEQVQSHPWLSSSLQGEE